MVLFWLVGGAKYRINNWWRFDEHIAFVIQQSLDAVVDLVHAEGKTFATEPRVGPWAVVIKNDAGFAESYQRQDPQKYIATVSGMSLALFDRDTAPGAEPEDMFQVDIPALI